MNRELITAPTLEPITLAEAKAHLRVVSADEDALISSLVLAARERAEIYTERALLQQTWEVSLDVFPTGDIRLPLLPLLSVVSVKYYDTDGVEQTLDVSEYYEDAKSKPARIVPVSNWPATKDRPNAVTITIEAGYGETADKVPQVIKQALLLMVGDMYENREETVVGTIVSTLPLTADRLLRPFRLLG
jgi:uncharacterized phiE125 gp8 family phage protein